jgi:phosphate starvation-inducible membrane PsiE
MPQERVESVHRKSSALADAIGRFMVDIFHYLALFAIGAVVVWSGILAFLGMVAKGHASIDDILLLFIYLELGAMVGIYFKTNHMPVRFLIYVAMTALTRLLIADVQGHHSPDIGIILTSGAILLLAFATLVIRYGSFKYPAVRSDMRD